MTNQRPYNFSAGPAMLPAQVLNKVAAEWFNWDGTGISVAEMSHRSDEFTSIYATAMQDLRHLLCVPNHYQILFLQGGAIAENSLVPLNLFGKQATADYAVTGNWSKKSYLEACRYGNINLAVSTELQGYSNIPDFNQWRYADNAQYLHICTNETINGVEFFALPDQIRAPIVADVSSHILSRPFNVSKFGVLYGGAQKNAGIAGLTIVIVREDLLDQAMFYCPSVFNWKNVAENNSMYNTPPTFAIYVAGLVFKWLKSLGGLNAVEQINRKKAKLLYDYIDQSHFYKNKVSKSVRSLMNIPFELPDSKLDFLFLTGAKANGLLNLKGHKAVGGMRASIYNAMPEAGVIRLVEYMAEFAEQYKNSAL